VGDGAELAALVAGAEAVVFDLDGVLVDSEPWWHEARVAWAAARGREWTEADSRACMGLSSREWSTVMRDRLRLDEAPAAIERAVVASLVERYRQEAPPAVDGAPAAVRRMAAALPVAIASSAHPAVIAAALEATGLAATFAVVVSADEVARGKPAPDVYLEAARRLGIAPARCLVVEDSAAGARAGRAAGMRVVLVPNASVPPGPGAEEAADAVVASLSEVPIGPGEGSG